jgi:multicomponent Na+:H+ antiporter subunit D
MTGKRKLTELGGLYRTMPLTLMLYMVGAVSISAFPFFSGFVSKSMVLAAAEQDHRAVVFLLLTLASSGTFLHTGLKLPYYMFFGKHDTQVTTSNESMEPPLNMLLAMALAALLCISIGVFPDLLYALLPHEVNFEPYTPGHITGALSILMFTALGFFLFLKQLDPERTISLDTDWIYRRGARLFLWFANNPVVRYEAGVSELGTKVVLRFLHAGAALGLWIDVHIIDGAVNGLARFILASGEKLRHMETGVLSHYALGMAIGIVFSVVVYAVLGPGIGP